MQHNFMVQLTFYPFQDKIDELPLTICNYDTVHICSRYGCHPDTHSDSDSTYSTDTLQTRMPSWYSFKINFQIQFRYAPDTDAILILIQRQLSDTLQIWSWFGCHYVTHSNIVQIQSPLDGIYKPISNNYPSFLQMASLSPFPIQSTTTSSSANFWAL